MNEIDWDRARDFMIHRTGNELNMDMLQDRIIQKHTYLNELFGGCRKTVRLESGALIRKRALDKLNDENQMITFMELWATDARMGSNEHAEELPLALTTCRIGRAKASTRMLAAVAASKPHLTKPQYQQLHARVSTLIENMAMAKKTAGPSSKFGLCVDISFDPYDLCHMGTYHCDQNACFVAGGDGNGAPIAIAQTEGGVFFSVYKEDEPWKLIGRCFGTITPDQFSWTNMYPNRDTANLDIVKALMPLVATELGYTQNGNNCALVKSTSAITVLGTTTRSNSARIYSNGDGQCYTKPGKTQRTMKIDVEGIPRSASYTGGADIRCAAGGMVDHDFYREYSMASLRSNYYPTGNGVPHLPASAQKRMLKKHGTHIHVPIALLGMLNMVQISDTHCCSIAHAMYDWVNKKAIHKDDAIEHEGGYTIKPPAIEIEKTPTKRKTKTQTGKTRPKEGK